ncbi:hypothetical protein GQ607_006809, partial [Colletotrichum asianum]
MHAEVAVEDARRCYRGIGQPRVALLLGLLIDFANDRRLHRLGGGNVNHLASTCPSSSIWTVGVRQSCPYRAQTSVTFVGC